MHKFSLSHLSDGDLLQSARHEFGCRRLATARFLAQLGEIDARKLYLPLAYDSMHAFCAGEFRMSAQQAYKWVQVARAGRRFPAVLEAIADGRLSRSAVVVLAPHLREENVAELLRGAEGKTEAELERWVANRSSRAQSATPQGDGPTDGADPSLSLRIVEAETDECRAPIPPDPTAPTLADLASQTHPLHLRLDDEALELLRYAQALLGHAEPSRDPSRIFKRSLQALVAELEKRKFGSSAKRRANRRGSTCHPRRIPVRIRHQVWLRDAGRCTFVSVTGRRCDSTRRLEYDHVVPVARGGKSTAANLRILCRAHNQHEAERAFGTRFMKEKRAAAEARPAAGETRATAGAGAGGAETRGAAVTTGRPFDGDVVRCLRRLGLRAGEAQEAAAGGGLGPETPLEERVRAALQWFGGGRRRVEAAPAPVAKAG